MIEVVESPVVEADTDEISPLLGDAAAAVNIDRPNPKMSIFSVSYSRKRSSPKVSDLFTSSLFLLFDYYFFYFESLVGF